MVFRRTKTFKKRARKAPRTAIRKANKALRMVNKIKPELKFRHVLVSNIAPGIEGTSFALTSGIERGVGPEQRVGSSIRPLYVNGHMMAYVPAATSSYYVRVFLVRMKQTVLVNNPPQDWELADILDTDSGIPYTLAPKLWARRKNFDILYDRRVNIHPDKNTHVWKFNIRLGGRLSTYREQDTGESAVTAAVSNAYRMFCVTDSGTPETLRVTSDFRFFYTDA